MQASFIGPPVLQTAFGIIIVDIIAPPEEVISTSYEIAIRKWRHTQIRQEESRYPKELEPYARYQCSPAT